MPLNIQYDPIRGLTRVTGQGKISASEIMGVVESFGRKTAICNILWDLREVALKDVTPEFIQDLALKVRQLRPARTKGRTAIVSSVDFIFGLARMLKAMIEYPDEKKQHPIMVFRDMDQAESWLEETGISAESLPKAYSDLVYQR